MLLVAIFRGGEVVLPDRFDGCNLSHARGVAPLADIPMMVIFAGGGKGRLDPIRFDE